LHCAGHENCSRTRSKDRDSLENTGTKSKGTKLDSYFNSDDEVDSNFSPIKKKPKKKLYSKVTKVENKEDKRFPRMKKFGKSKLDMD
jgi:hypothetical protein